MKKVGIIGGAGYTAGELIRLLMHHPQVSLTSIVSESQKGKPLTAIHRDLRGETDLHFAERLDESIDILFLCQGHGRSASFLERHPQLLQKTIIDLSTDFRPRDNDRHFTYGLPEWNQEAIQTASHITNPGCFATAIQLALLPLAQQQLLQHPVHIHGITGSTGAGQQPKETTHFSWRNNNVSIYKCFQHQHEAEILESIHQLQANFDQPLFFVPIRGNFSRGILISAYTTCDRSEEALLDLYRACYDHHPFTHVTDQEIALKEVVNTNKCVIQLRKSKGQVHLTTIIDNLLKGASGQAIQNMNLRMGWKETEGLNLKSIAF